MNRTRSVSSSSLQTAHELTVIAPIKEGLVEISDPMSYKVRLERLLDVLFQQRKYSVEVGGSGFVGPLEQLRSLHFVHWSIIEDDKKLLLTVAYDKPWETYIRTIVDEAGPLLDVIFFHCEGYEHSTTRHGYPAFARWVRAHQRKTNFFYADFPELTIDDIRYHRNLRGLHDSLTADALPLDARVNSLQPRDDPEQLIATALNLYRLKTYYPKRGHVSAAQPDQHAKFYTDRAIFNRAVKQIAQGYSSTTLDEISSLGEEEGGALAKARALRAAYNDFTTWYAEVMAKPNFEMPPVEEPDRDQVQGNILTSYAQMNHGCAVLASWAPGKAGDALRFLSQHVTTEETAGKVDVKLNAALTYNGLQALRLDAADLLRFPVEFREGMQARAGLLGDVANNHPVNWRLPLRNWPRDRHRSARVDLSTIDVVVTLETRQETLAFPIASILAELNGLKFDEASTENRRKVSLDIQGVLKELDERAEKMTTEQERAEGKSLYSALEDVRTLLKGEGPPEATYFAKRVAKLREAADKLEPESVDEPLLPLLTGEIQRLEAAGLQILHVQPLRRYEKRRKGAFYREHFGFLDGLSETKTVAAPNLQAGPYNSEISYGEALVGYANDHGDMPSPDVAQSAVLKNGSFLVMRKLTQAVDELDGYVKKATARTGATEDEIRGFLMGRKPDGTSLAADANPLKVDDFTYKDDNGVGSCPYQAHVRLANPRFDTRTSVHGRPMRVPRILRRGFSYGPPLSPATKGAERGLLFMAYGASIAEQYEVVQRWLNGGNSTGLPSAQNDPITAPGDPNRAPFRYRSKDGRVVKLPAITRPFVKLEWGLYLFAPARAGLAALAAMADAANALDPFPPEVKKLGAAKLADLLSRDEQLRTAADAATSPEREQLLAQGITMWKMALEGQGEAEREDAAAIWLAIRAAGGVLKTCYGVLVGTKEEALQVLKDERLYSVREYWRRMDAAKMPMHLGMDASPVPHAVCPVEPGTRERFDARYVGDIRSGRIDYERSSSANALLTQIGRAKSFKAAYTRTRRVLADCAKMNERVVADLFVVGEKVIAELSQDWFGLPDGEFIKVGGQPIESTDETPHCPADFTTVAHDFFRANPDEWTRKVSGERGAKIRAAATKVVSAALQSPRPHEFIQALQRSPALAGLPSDKLQDHVTDALVGAVDGFVAANWGSFVTTIGQWIRRRELWRVRLRCEADIERVVQFEREATERQLEHELDSARTLWGTVNAALMAAPVPPWLYRTAVASTKLGNVPIEPGDRVVLNLSSIAIDGKDPALLFGGPYSHDKGAGPEQTPRHACPARPAASGVLLGMLCAVLKCENIRAEGPLVISFDSFA